MLLVLVALDISASTRHCWGVSCARAGRRNRRACRRPREDLAVEHGRTVAEISSSEADLSI